MFDSPQMIPSNTFIFSAMAMVNAHDAAIDLCLQILNTREPAAVNGHVVAQDDHDA